MKSFLLLLTLILSTYSFAGPGGGHSHGHSHGHSKKVVNKEQTKKIGKKEIARLVKKGKLNASWNDAVFANSEKKKFGKKTEWVVTYDNENGVKGKKLYVFLSLSGKFVAANFTGK